MHVTAVIGGQLQWVGMGSVKLQLVEGQVAVEVVIIADKKLLGFYFIIRMNGISALRGVMVNAQGQVQCSRAGAVVVASADAAFMLKRKILSLLTTRPPAPARLPGNGQTTLRRKFYGILKKSSRFLKEPEQHI
ncbi:hypothetical protein M514_07265 [Trichuris suis]|uniref:Uncharacterized protein n=1 Tax=Trichuris suis TaxID=68888 RepID=A0A085N1I7_9BILA|nr:hypothetical protein M513_07265 [Trichuris suis]KFD63333.1 hypothetical protein M514_07265 [Trichuris suis]